MFKFVLLKIFVDLSFTYSIIGKQLIFSSKLIIVQIYNFILSFFSHNKNLTFTKIKLKVIFFQNILSQFYFQTFLLALNQTKF